MEDASNLSDIENVKGKEKFTQSGDKLTWQAGGKDIYYQGTATEEPPVTQKVTYYLDGKKSHLRTLQENQERSKSVLTTQIPHHIQRQ